MIQAVLLVYLASVLANRARQLSERVANAVMHESSIKQFQMLKLQCEVLVEDAESKVLALQKLSENLTKMGATKQGLN